MMSPETIRSLTKQAARKSREQGQEPLRVTSRDLGVLGQHLRNIPNLGDRCPRGWKRVPANSLFKDGDRMGVLVPYGGDEAGHYIQVDSSGWGGPNEPSFTFSQFCQWVSERGEGYGFAIVEAGQFQVVVGIFKSRDA